MQARTSVAAIAVHLHCYVNLQEKKKTLPLSGTLNHYEVLFLMYSSPLRTPSPRSEAARLNSLLFEVVAIATPHVAYAFVTKKPVCASYLWPCWQDADTRRATKSQLPRCSCLRE